MVAQDAPLLAPPLLGGLLVRDLPLEMLAQLDWASFQGTPDEAFVAEDAAADQRLLSDILAGRGGSWTTLRPPL